MKRYDLGSTFADCDHLVERPDGEWVRFSDVEPLIAALREIAAEGHDERDRKVAHEALAKLEGGGK